ncbi:tail fiber domain-containing protein [Pedobacter endophyticus]|uniref:Tail fiber domain-containing protein n=1 Tax=Pedobacter endophyticus TaxID=2789740 RepID=A0A7S9L385_9SPHI|nr:tail fiber domain-containing protein [Pedobacter endophyticus]QPH41638.1 tail fiber domain-containing protein [Pedobacter endophyticus]
MKRAISFSFAVFLIAASLKISAQEVTQTNVKPVNNSLEMVSKLEPVSFNYDKSWANKLKLPVTEQYGFVGSAAKASVPSLITVQAKDYPTGKNASSYATITKVDYESLIPLLVGSIKEQQQQIEDLKREIRSLRTERAK